MSIWISKLENGTRTGIINIGKDIDELPELFTLFKDWLLNDSKDIDNNFEWIADIGFSQREGASGGGPMITTDIMKICIDKNISIYLSEYDTREEAV